MIRQKSFTVDFLTKKKKANEGEIPQYYVENSHPAIVSPEIYDLVQIEIDKRINVKGYKTGASCFSGKIVCGECGSFYGSKVWHSTSIYRRTIWQCNNKFKNEKKCKTPHIYEEKLKQAFINAFNSLLDNKEEILQNYESIIKVLTDTLKLDKEKAEILMEIKDITKRIQTYVEMNSYTTINQEEYNKNYSIMEDKYKKIKCKLEEINNKYAQRKARRTSHLVVEI